ncbi:MAG: helix-turn-helix domain-containing protein [Bacteroides sp.]|nr:helix-turn-helix domain-containing protein [Bacillota bacterium]MCM1394169.1 helix-turn-helix domain-containing protein [[Eubacterium] siraeum]MCM1455966.1 helix-turn-helix domain-containing protein [Bacteroides sp.]
MYLSNFVYTLKELLIENDLKQSELSEKLGLGSSTISRYLLEKQTPDIEVAVKIADYFDCSVDYLLGFEDNYKDKTYHEYPPFSKQFLYLLDRFKISRYKLQKLTEISKSTMYYWQKGKNKPTMDNVIKLAKALDCSIDFVLGRIDFD